MVDLKSLKNQDCYVVSYFLVFSIFCLLFLVNSSLILNNKCINFVYFVYLKYTYIAKANCKSRGIIRKSDGKFNYAKTTKLYGRYFKMLMNNIILTE